MNGERDFTKGDITVTVLPNVKADVIRSLTVIKCPISPDAMTMITALETFFIGRSLTDWNDFPKEWRH